MKKYNEALLLKRLNELRLHKISIHDWAITCDIPLSYVQKTNIPVSVFDCEGFDEFMETPITEIMDMFIQINGRWLRSNGRVNHKDKTMDEVIKIKEAEWKALRKERNRDTPRGYSNSYDTIIRIED